MEMRKTLFQKLKAIFDELHSLHHCDTKKYRDDHGDEMSFECIHWCWWARYCVQVCIALFFEFDFSELLMVIS